MNTSEDIARSMMYVGGVHSLISMMTKFNNNVDILKHCCNALGTFASHGNEKSCHLIWYNDRPFSSVDIEIKTGAIIIYTI